MEKTDGTSLAVERIDQAVKLLTEQLEAVREERELLRQATTTLLDHLDQMETHWRMATVNMAASARMESELRDSVQEAHRLLDKMPGKRHY